MNSHAAPGSQDSRRWLTLAIAATGLFLICVDLTVLYIALPLLTEDLGADSAAKLWILNAYPIVVAGLLPGLGTLGDRYGHRRLFVAGLATFGAASLAAAYAPTSAFLIGARAAQGCGAGMMMPATLAIIRASFSSDRERSLAIGIWSGIAAGGMALGPIIAGALLERFDWGSVFLINVPVVLVALPMTLLFVPARAAPGGPRWDVAGSLQLLVGLTALVYGIKEFARQDFSLARMSIALVIGSVAFGTYARGQRSRTQQLIDFTLFRLPNFSGAVAAACLGTAGAVGVELALSQYLQLVEQRSPLQAALVMLPMAVAGFLAGPLAGRAMHGTRAAPLAACGFVLAAACAVTLALVPVSAAAFHAIRLLLLGGIGFGLGATVTFASSVIMNAAPAERGGMAASIEEVGFELGNALGVAVFGSLMTLAYAMTLALPEMPAPLPAAVQDSLDAALLAADALPAEPAAALREAGRAAFGNALQAVLIGVGALWMATGIALLVTRPRPSI